MERRATPHLSDSTTGVGPRHLRVDDRPFLVLGGELHNSSSSSVDEVRHAMDRIADLNLNTVLAPVAWNQFEPREGEFDFELIDGLLASARHHVLRLIPLWFGAWKNGRSSYMPAWVRRDAARFPRAILTSGEHCEHLSPFSEEVRDADARAFAALMRHVREVDEATGTIIMVQVENEVGLLGDSRDRSVEAESRFAESVPPDVLDALDAHPETRIARAWTQRGRRREGTWTALFGEGDDTDEAFMAAAFSRHIEFVAKAGKAEYDVPMFANAWLNTPTETQEGTPAGGQRPGDYPSGGPLPQVGGLWVTLAPSLDFVVPDIYFGNFREICEDYSTLCGGLFIPEMRRDAVGAADLFVAIGSFGAIGVSPFGIDSLKGEDGEPLADAYRLLHAISDSVLAFPSVGIHLDDDEPEMEFRIGRFDLTARREPVGPSRAVGHGYGVVIEEADDTFLIAGRGLHLEIRDAHGRSAELVSVVELSATSSLAPARQLNGDETLSGVTVLLPSLGSLPPSTAYQIPTMRRSEGILRILAAEAPTV